jgi:hypothetical protein
MLPKNLEWDQPIIEDDAHRDRLLSGLVIFAAVENGLVRPIGTGFIVNTFGNCADVITAAHNLDAIHGMQAPASRSHRSALPEFLASPKPLNIERDKVRAICFQDGAVEFAIVEFFFCDETADIAIVRVRTQEPGSDFFKRYFLLAASVPEADKTIAVLGLFDFDVAIQRDGDKDLHLTLEHRVVIRTGRIKEYYPDGHLLCRGPCVETSIPVFGGMSGGPVMLFEPGKSIMPFGLVSSDPEDETDKNDRSQSGRLIVALLPIKVTKLDSGQQEVELNLTLTKQVVVNSEFQADRA